MIKILNNEKNYILITAKVHTHSFLGFKLYINNNVIDSYNEICDQHNCYTCTRCERRVSQ